MSRLVIIDDESHISDIITRYFREKGHDVVGTTSAEEAFLRSSESRRSCPMVPGIAQVKETGNSPQPWL